MRIPFLNSQKKPGLEAGTPPTPPADSLEAKLDAMRERFLIRVRADYEVLAPYRPGRLPPTRELIQVVHKLAGSAGMIGLMEISETAGRLDDELADPQSDTSAGLEALLVAMEKAMGASRAQ